MHPPSVSNTLEAPSSGDPVSVPAFGAPCEENCNSVNICFMDFEAPFVDAYMFRILYLKEE